MGGRDAITISARAACKRADLDLETWTEFVYQRVADTNGAYGPGGGIDRTCVAQYCRVTAVSIRLALHAGVPETDIRRMGFCELWNYEPPAPRAAGEA